jgi:ABC-type transport system involved in multi-copper enzyme maturation permease subunit
MFKQLLWKEWRENLWKLTFGTAVSAAFVLLLFRIRLFPDAANCIAVSFVQMFAIPVIYALDIFSGEMTNRTIHLLFKFPVPRWKIFFAKYLTCILGMALIFLTTGVLMELAGQGREAETGFFAVFIGWGIIFMWSGICEVPWAIRFVPYALIDIPNASDEWPNPVMTFVSQLSAFILILYIACYRFVKVRRVL